MDKLSGERDTEECGEASESPGKVCVCERGEGREEGGPGRACVAMHMPHTRLQADRTKKAGREGEAEE